MFTYQPVVLIDNVWLNILFMGVKHPYDSQLKSSILKEFFFNSKKKYKTSSYTFYISWLMTLI